jgi:hypothetical protein
MLGSETGLDPSEMLCFPLGRRIAGSERESRALDAARTREGLPLIRLHNVLGGNIPATRAPSIRLPALPLRRIMVTVPCVVGFQVIVVAWPALKLGNPVGGTTNGFW